MSNRTHGWIGLVGLNILLTAIVGCASPGKGREAIRVTRAEEIPWLDVRDVLAYDASSAVAARTHELDEIDRVLRKRAVFHQPGIGFGQLMLGSGALYPSHSHATPEAYHVISGEAEWTVDGETRRVGPGSSIYHAPYADHRWVTTSAEPLRVLWARWTPGGNRSGLIADGARRRGGGATGAFFAGEKRSRSVLVIEMVSPIGASGEDGFTAEMRRARLEARLAEPKRPVIRAFVDSVGSPWNTEWPGIRWRPVFGTPDLEWGHVEFSSEGTDARATRIPASATPGLLHVLSGRARMRVVGGAASDVAAGTTFAFWPGEAIEVEFEEGAPSLRAIWVRWAPDGDPTYWARDYFLVESFSASESPTGSVLPRDARFFLDSDD